MKERSHFGPLTMTTVSLDDLDSAMEWVSTDFLDNEAYVCRDSGKIYWISGEHVVLDEEEEIPDDIEDTDKYVPYPISGILISGRIWSSISFHNSCHNTMMKCATCFAAKGLMVASRTCWKDKTRQDPELVRVQ